MCFFRKGIYAYYTRISISKLTITLGFTIRWMSLASKRTPNASQHLGQHPVASITCGISVGHISRLSLLNYTSMMEVLLCNEMQISATNAKPANDIPNPKMIKALDKSDKLMGVLGWVVGLRMLFFALRLSYRSLSCSCLAQ